ncbi:MAG TPA: hypothetical protein VIN56_00060 [Candidatus Dormibacteraeota bacterium]|jgi:hypothetical protein
MRERLLGVAEVCAWAAMSFTVFLGLRIVSIFLSVIDPAQCVDSCDAGSQAIPLTLFVFGLGWFPLVLVSFVRYAKRGPELWWVPHAVVVVAAHAVAMVIVVRIFATFTDADTRTGLLAASAAAADVVTGLLLLLGATRTARVDEPGGEPQT